MSDVAVRRLPQDASLVAVERTVADAIRRACKEFNQRLPDVIVIAHEMDPRYNRKVQANTVGMTSTFFLTPNCLYSPRNVHRPVENLNSGTPGDNLNVFLYWVGVLAL